MSHRNTNILSIRVGLILSLALAISFVLPPIASTAAAETTLLYTSVNPCRVVDTRVAGGKFAAGEARSYEIAGITDFSSTGGNPNGCGIPHFETLLDGGVTLIPRIVAIQVASTEAEGLGHFRAWPGGQEQKLAAVLNFAPDHKVSNMIHLQMCDEVALTVDELCLLDDGGDFTIEARISDSHLVIDVLGYFHNAEPPL